MDMICSYTSNSQTNVDQESVGTISRNLTNVEVDGLVKVAVSGKDASWILTSSVIIFTMQTGEPVQTVGLFVKNDTRDETCSLFSHPTYTSA